MEVVWAILTWAIFGLVVGAIARFLVPGEQSMSIILTMVLGVVGSLLGVFLWGLIEGELQPEFGWMEFLFSILGAVFILLIAEGFRSRTTA